jgi:hypothetical protein
MKRPPSDESRRRGTLRLREQVAQGTDEGPPSQNLHIFSVKPVLQLHGPKTEAKRSVRQRREEIFAKAKGILESLGAIEFEASSRHRQRRPLYPSGTILVMELKSRVPKSVEPLGMERYRLLVGPDPALSSNQTFHYDPNIHFSRYLYSTFPNKYKSTNSQSVYINIYQFRTGSRSSTGFSVGLNSSVCLPLLPRG